MSRLTTHVETCFKIEKDKILLNPTAISNYINANLHIKTIRRLSKLNILSQSFTVNEERGGYLQQHSRLIDKCDKIMESYLGIIWFDCSCVVCCGSILFGGSFGYFSGIGSIHCHITQSFFAVALVCLLEHIEEQLMSVNILSMEALIWITLKLNCFQNN